MLVLIAGGLFVAWFIWCFVALAKKPYSRSAKDWLSGLGSFGAYFVEGGEEDGSIVPRDRELTTWHKIQGVAAVVGLVVLLLVAAHELRIVIDHTR